VSVEKGRAAESAGLEVGDILVGIGSTPLKDHDGLVGAIAELGAGAKAEAEVLRGGKLKKVPLTVGGV
jgi:serine protease Do